MQIAQTLDVTVIEPRLKHPTIFKHFDSLHAGESFIIHNDHDPKPLYYQLLGERGDVFNWEYLMEGPEIWEVRISKHASGEAAPTIGEMVTKDYRKAEVFKKYGLDFCCGGKKTLAKACKEKGLDAAAIEKDLKEVEQQPKGKEQDFTKWDAGFLADYITNTHHSYVKESIPVLLEYTGKVAKVHGDQHPEAIEIASLFEAVAKELTEHMVKEDTILFPFIKRLSEAHNHDREVQAAAFGSVDNPIRMMEHEHDEVGRMMERIRELAANFTPPADACTTYRLSYAKLEEFEGDLHQHIHLENNILFPKAAELERNSKKS